MAEPRQFTNVFTGNVGGAIQATNTIATSTLGGGPVANANTWAPVGTPFQVVQDGIALEADHASGGARSYEISFHGRVSKLAGNEGSVNVHIYLNGAVLPNPLFRMVTCNPNDPASEFTMFGTETLVVGDEISIWLENVDDEEPLQLIEGATLKISS